MAFAFSVSSAFPLNGINVEKQQILFRFAHLRKKILFIIKIAESEF